MNMDSNWAILNISPTEDREAIKRAYMRQLPKYNPEDDPQAFLSLRSAYEEILKQLDKPNELEDIGPMALFMQRVEGLYRDFARRCDVEEWKDLLKDDLCMRLDMEDLTSARILVFLMNHYYLPYPVWVLLDKHFGWQGKEAILKQDFPANYIDFVITSTQFNSFNYDLFVIDPDQLFHIDDPQYDRWLWLFYEMEALLHNPNEQAFLEMKQEIEAMPIRHVYYDLQKARIHILNGEAEAALAITAPIFEEMPNDTRARYVHALTLDKLAKSLEAQELFQSLLEENPEDYGAKKGLIESMMNSDDHESYEKARHMLLEILDEYPYNPFALHSFRLITEKLVLLYEEKYEENPKEMDTVLSLAKHYLNSYQHEKCQKILEVQEFPQSARYYEYLADCYAAAGEFERAIQLYEKNISLEKGYRNYVKFVSALVDAEKFGQALVCVEEALQHKDEDRLSLAYLYDNKGIILHRLDQYSEALLAFDAGIELNSQSAHIYIHKARTYQQMLRLTEALSCCEQAIAIFPYTTEAYTIQMEIFYDADLFDKMLDLSSQADQVGFESPRVLYHKACALRMLGRKEEAGEILTELLEAEFDEGYRDFFYVEKAYIAVADGDNEAALSYITKAIDINGDYPYRYIFLGSTYRFLRRYTAAFEVYNELLDKFPGYTHALMGRGDVYFDQENYKCARADYKAVIDANEHSERAYNKIIDSYEREGRYVEAYEWAERALQFFEDVENHLRMCWLLGKTNRQDETGAAYQRVIKQFPDDERAYRNFGMFLRNMERYTEAKRQYEISLEKEKNQPYLYAEIAYCLAYENRFDEALAILDKGESLHPGQSGDIYMRKGLILHKMDRQEQSLEFLLKAMECEKEIAGHWNMSYLYSLIGTKYVSKFNDANQAMKYFRIALEKNPENAEAIISIGDIYLYYHKDYSEALAHYEHALSIDPEEQLAYLGRALAYRQLKRYLRANRDFKKALSLLQEKIKTEKEYRFFKIQIALCYIGLRKYNLARKMLFDEIKEGGRGLDECYYGIGLSYERQRKYREAADYYNKAIQISNAVQYREALKRL